MKRHKLDTEVLCVKLVENAMFIVDAYKKNRKVGAIGTVDNFFSATQLDKPEGVYHVIVDGQITAFWESELEQI